MDDTARKITDQIAQPEKNDTTGRKAEVPILSFFQPRYLVRHFPVLHFPSPIRITNHQPFTNTKYLQCNTNGLRPAYNVTFLTVSRCLLPLSKEGATAPSSLPLGAPLLSNICSLEAHDRRTGCDLRISGRSTAIMSTACSRVTDDLTSYDTSTAPYLHR